MIQEVIISNPKVSVIALSFLVTLFMTLVTKKFTDQNRMKELKKIQKACQINLKDHKGNPEKLGEIQKEMTSCSIELMKHSFKPMLVTMLPLLFFFWWIKGIFVLTDIANSWLWYYIITSMVSSIILRKVLDVV